MTLQVKCPLCCHQGFSTAESLCSALVGAASKKLSCPICGEDVIGMDKLTIHLFGHATGNITNAAVGGGIVPIALENVNRIDTAGIKGLAPGNPLAPGNVMYFTSDNGHLYAVGTNVLLNQLNSSVPSTDCEPANVPAQEVGSNSFESAPMLQENTNAFASCKELLTSGDFSVMADVCSTDDKNSGTTCFTQKPSSIETSEADSAQSLCDSCDQPFSNKAILAVHKQLSHKGSPEVSDVQKMGDKSKRRPLVCNWCTATFTLKSSLLAHIKVTHPGQKDSGENQPRKESEKPACQICGQTFSKEGALHHHMKLNHGEKPWQCGVCSKTFTTKYFLRKHKRIHTGETPYECSICHKVFTFQQSYHKHMLYHTDDKPYCCSHCGRLFKELSTLNNHERIHSGEKPFACENCGKSFRQRVSYLVHRRIHTGAMPYRCTACDKSFRYKISQRTHKCTVQPPGEVVKTQDSLMARLQAVIDKEEDKQGAPMERLAGNSATSLDSVAPGACMHPISPTSEGNFSNTIDSRTVGCENSRRNCLESISGEVNSTFVTLDSNSQNEFPSPYAQLNPKLGSNSDLNRTYAMNGYLNGINSDSCKTVNSVDSSPTEILNRLHISAVDYGQPPLQHPTAQQNFTFDSMEDMDLCNFLFEIP